jgi:hypothetical protein
MLFAHFTPENVATLLVVIAFEAHPHSAAIEPPILMIFLGIHVPTLVARIVGNT